MKIKHTHPAYESRENRIERLKEVRRSSMEVLFAQRGCEKADYGKGGK